MMKFEEGEKLEANLQKKINDNSREKGQVGQMRRKVGKRNYIKKNTAYLTDDQLNRLGLLPPRHCWTLNNELASLASLQEQDKIDKWKRKAKTTVGAKLGRDC
ncbi:Aspartate carbamoyltransferase regulatory chain [Trichinella spiralis]|uniref:Aspartate carbamoyltransferase regulatory chain n=1 Tax=Trichinella spiralis TaxID=6334 RepID=A0ABR3K8H5_TRISP